MPRCWLMPACCVELGHELAVGGACCGEVLVAFAELEAHVADLLLQSVVALAERVDVGRGAEPGFPPGVLAEECGEPAFELLDAGGHPGGSLLGVEQIGLQRGTARRGPGSRRGRRVCLGHVDLFEQVAVPVEECPVNTGGAGDAGGADLVSGGGSSADGLEDAGPAAGGIGLAPAQPGPCGLGGGHAVRSGRMPGSAWRSRGMARVTVR